MKKYLLLCAALLCGAISAHGQTLTGRVYGETGDETAPLAGASVYCPETLAGVTAAANGSFSLTPGDGARRLVVSFVGFASDTVELGIEWMRVGEVAVQYEVLAEPEVAVLAGSACDDNAQIIRRQGYFQRNKRQR